MLHRNGSLAANTDLVCEQLLTRTVAQTGHLRAEELVASTLAGDAGLLLLASVEAPGEEEALEEVVAAGVAGGIDAERICSAVIHYESQFHLGLVWMEANRLAKSFPEHSPEDLAGWGWLGLRTALRRFEPSRGHRFSTYACYRINGTIRDGVRDENPVPKRLVTLQRRVASAEEQLTTSLGRAPHLAEVAEHLEESLETLTRLLPRLSVPASVDELGDPESERTMAIAATVDTRDPADDAVEAVRDIAVRDAMEKLDPQARQAVRLLVWEQRSMAEVRRMTGLSDRELRRHHERGCEELRNHLSNWADSFAA